MLATATGPVKPLSPRVYRVLHEGRSVDASADAWSCLLGLLQSGYGPADVLKMARDGLPGFRHYSDLARRRGWQHARRKILDREIPKARRIITTRPAALDPSTVQAELSAIAATIDARPDLWARRTGTSDRVVLIALVGIARKLGRTQFGASVRQVSLAANMRPGTVCAALSRLVADGTFLELSRPARGIEAAEYRLRLPYTSAGTVEVPDDCAGTERTMAEAPDLFARTTRDAAGNLGNLGPGVGVTYSLTSAHPITPAELVRLTARSKSTIYEHLQKLVGAGLARAVAGGWVRTRQTVAAAAAKLGAKAVREVRRAQFDRARRWFHQRQQAIQQAKALRWRRNQARAYAHRHGLILVDHTLIRPTTAEAVRTYTTDWTMPA